VFGVFAVVGGGPPKDPRQGLLARAAVCLALLSNRKLLKRKLIDIENHIRGTLRAYGLLIGAVGRGSYEARVRELLEHSDPDALRDLERLERILPDTEATPAWNVDRL